MAHNFLQILKEICIKNFSSYLNISEKESNSNNYAPTKESKLNDLKFPNEEISNLIFQKK